MEHELITKYRMIPPKLKLLHESYEDGVLVIRRADKPKPIRKVLFVCNYGMAQGWQLWKDGIYPGNHLWGCIELALKGYEILLPEPAKGSGLKKRLRNDWPSARIAMSRLNSNDIVYCAHNVLLWTPLLKMLKMVRCKVVGLLFAQDPLALGKFYDGIIAHTPVAQKNIAKKFPKVKCSHISWGMDMDFFHAYPYDPKWFLSCGKTFRDFQIIADAFEGSAANATIIHPRAAELPAMPQNIKIEGTGSFGDGIYAPLAEYYYRYTSASLLTFLPDAASRHSIGLTNLFESMACARPSIVTQTGALTSEVDVQNVGVGLYVKTLDVAELKQAIARITNQPDEARQMGLRGRKMCEEYFNIDRYTDDLHSFFEKL